MDNGWTRRHDHTRSWIGGAAARIRHGSAYSANAPAHTFTQCSGPFIYTALYNVLDYAGGVVPWTTVSTADVRDCAAATHPDTLAYNWVYEACARDTAAGLPVAVQVVTPPYREEMCLHVMQLLADVKRDTQYT